MEDWVLHAIERWPDVPHLYGWLGLDRRGRWTIRGETISRPQIVDTISANYAADVRGCWYFQNGPQRGYVTLEAAPLILHVDGDSATLRTHTQRLVEAVTAAWLTEDGAILLDTGHGPALLADADLDWALARLSTDTGALTETALAAALALPDGSATALRLAYCSVTLPVQRLDAAAAPARLGYVLDPLPPAAAR